MFCKTPKTQLTSKNLLNAKQECSQNQNCTMFYDRCGKGNEFWFCSDVSETKDSTCDSILYSKKIEGKL